MSKSYNAISIASATEFDFGHLAKYTVACANGSLASGNPSFSAESTHALVIVIACGTATSQAIDILQQKFEIPIIGIIKPTVEYIKEKEYKEVGVIATEGTIRSGEWERQLRKNISNINVINKACPMLATIAEEGRATGIEGRNAIKEYMKSFKEKKINKIILGCTHFPIYEQVIRDELKYDVELINTGKTVAKYLEEYLNEKELYTQSKKGSIKIELTKKEEEFSRIVNDIFKEKV